MKKSELRKIIREEIQRLREIKKKDPTLKQMLDFLKNQSFGYRGFTDKSFEYIEAIYWYAADKHTGQSSNLYKAMGEVKRKHKYKPSPGIRGIQDTDVDTQMFYAELEDEFG